MFPSAGLECLTIDDQKDTGCNNTTFYVTDKSGTEYVLSATTYDCLLGQVDMPCSGDFLMHKYSRGFSDPVPFTETDFHLACCCMWSSSEVYLYVANNIDSPLSEWSVHDLSEEDCPICFAIDLDSCFHMDHTLPVGLILPHNLSELTLFEQRRLVNIYRNKTSLSYLGLEDFNSNYLNGKCTDGNHERETKEKQKRASKKKEMEVARRATSADYMANKPTRCCKTRDSPSFIEDDLLDASDVPCYRDTPYVSDQRTSPVPMTDTPRGASGVPCYRDTPCASEQIELFPSFNWFKYEQKNIRNVSWSDLPTSLRESSFMLHVHSLATGETDVLTGQEMFKYVSHQSGQRNGTGYMQFRGFQVQLSIFGPNKPRLGIVDDTRVGAVISAAALIDIRLQFKESVKAWLLWIINGDDRNVSKWLDECSVNILKDPERIYLKRGRKKGNAFLARKNMVRDGYVHESGSLPIPFFEHLPPHGVDIADTVSDDLLVLPLNPIKATN